MIMSSELEKAKHIADMLAHARDLVSEICEETMDGGCYSDDYLLRIKTMLYKAAEVYRRDYLEILAVEVNLEGKECHARTA